MPQTPIISETTWLEKVVHIDHQEIPNGKTLILTLANGHRYAIPLTGQLLREVQNRVSPITIVGRDAMPPHNNGYGV